MDVIEQMADVGLTGLTKPDLIIDGSLHRFRPDWEPKANKKRAWYVLFPFKTDSGNELVCGSFGWFKGADAYSFNVSLKQCFSLSDAEKMRLSDERRKKQVLVEKERKAEHEKSAKRALDIWNKLSEKGPSKYLQQKKVAAFNVRFSKGAVVVPVQNFNNQLSGIQFIYEDGKKTFLSGTDKKGNFSRLGEITDEEGYIAVVEGYATGASIRMATQWPVMVAFDAGNLIHVAKAVRSKYPTIKIIICGDDDFGNPDNPGRHKAIEAAKAVGGLAVFPARDEVAA